MKGTLLTCQELGIVPRGDPLLQAVFIISTVHGFVSLVNDNRISHLVVDQYSDEDIQAFVLSTMFEGLGAANPP
jgi:hypothetical protein